ncbi:DENN domain-containing protein 10 [Corythoichthys intestinalis]|uniref:DENN domain-containing protein 10 n=1 Tax=Corythoichthys intestinalis TaxID=161448 RepID=UPI0025A53867|nr:DENN domain-containing protein 10 [Corythoichthys intestinalis]XP_061794208.1 DENN domain-containing protein 10-like isoform X1 [Nerophis lumbriciformis]
MASTETPSMLSVGLIEKDVNGDTLWVWCYPAVSSELRQVLLTKCCLTQSNEEFHTFVFGQFCRTWYYISALEVQEPTALTKVTHLSVVVTAKDFNPEKYAALNRILCRMYIKHGSPVKMMEVYIAVLTKGICQSEENGSFLIKDYDVRKAFLAGSIKDVVSQFGMETIILYTAVMLKKRIAVYHPRIEALLEFTRALPTLAWHRKDWSILHPYVHLNERELEHLSKCPGYIAGFVDPEVNNRTDLFDVNVNLPESAITVSQSAKESMMMGKLHKEVGHLIVQSAEDTERSDGQVIKDISLKTKQILTHLGSLADQCEGSKITLEHLRQQHFPSATENFLFHLAAAEQILRI